MQSVSAAFTAEEKDSVRKITQGLLVSWKKETNLSQRTFTIGVSTIGGPDIIGITPGAIGGPGIYNYFNESDYVTALAWERGFSMPVGGINKALAEANLDNTSHRFMPRYMGGNSELYTSILPRRPIIVNAGFHYAGINNVIPQFTGVLNKQPRVDKMEGDVQLEAADFIDFLQNRKLDQEEMFTGLRTDEVMETLLGTLGLATSQYELDTGINIIPFGYFEKGTNFGNIFHQLAEAENGQFYQDEEGRFIFTNRQHWDTAPYNAVQRVIQTSQVINAEAPSADNIVNVVEINANILNKQPEQIIFRLNTFDAITVPGNATIEAFLDFEDPILSMTTPSGSNAGSYFRANTMSDKSGTDATGYISIDKVIRFAKAVKVIFRNTNPTDLYVTDLVITGRPAKKERELYLRETDESSVTAYEEQVYRIDNPFIQQESWAQSLARMILNDFSDPENMQVITIRAIPSLQLGDTVSWQGRYWKIMHIRSTLNSSSGFIQELTLVQRTLDIYFRIGISTIGSTDRIAP